MNTELKQLVDDFDNGKEIKTVIMGGISDGYEIAIQKLAIEMMRIFSKRKVPQNQKTINSIVDSVTDKAISVTGDLGYSGAQVGAAQNLSAIYWRQTPEGALSKMKDADRIITIHKSEDGKIVLSKSVVDD